MAMKKDNTAEKLVAAVQEIQLSNMHYNIIGTSPLVPHAMSFKAAGSLLFPAPKKNAAEKATSMKHEPYEEFLDAAYKFTDADDQPTRLYMPAGAFHGAMASVAIDMAGAKKSQIGRLTSVPGLKIPVWGIPQIHRSIVRSSDMARTPDVRTLPILEEWAAKIEVNFIGSLVTGESVSNLLSAAGVIIGIGDGRPEKGKLTNGMFRLCSDDDADFLRIMKTGGRKAQDQALADPRCFDLETERLLDWFAEEKKRRVANVVAAPKKPKAKVADVVAGAAKKSGNGRRRHTT